MGILRMMTMHLLISYVASSGNQPLTRLTNHHIELSVKRRWSVPTGIITWHFEANKMKIKIAEYENKISIFYQAQFDNRLELSNRGRKLHIKNLRMEDSGSYVCTITLRNHEIYKEKFYLVLYDPVPAPAIKTKLEQRTSDWCNVTLHCSVPISIPSLSYSWKYRHKDSDYQLYNNTKDTINLLLQPESAEMEVMCIVNNPADQKNSSRYVHGCSVDEHSILFRKEMARKRFILVIACTIVLALLIWLKRSRGGRRKYKLAFVVGVLSSIQKLFQKQKKRTQSHTTI